MSAGNDKNNGRELHSIVYEVGIDMRLQMINRNHRQIQSGSQSFGCVHSHHERGHQSRALGYGNIIQITKFGFGFFERQINRRNDRRDMAASYHYAHHPAVWGMELGLGSNKM